MVYIFSRRNVFNLFRNLPVYPRIVVVGVKNRKYTKVIFGFCGAKCILYDYEYMCLM